MAATRQATAAATRAGVVGRGSATGRTAPATQASWKVVSARVMAVPRAAGATSRWTRLSKPSRAAAIPPPLGQPPPPPPGPPPPPDPKKKRGTPPPPPRGRFRRPGRPRAPGGRAQPSRPPIHGIAGGRGRILG